MNPFLRGMTGSQMGVGMGAGTMSPAERRLMILSAPSVGQQPAQQAGVGPRVQAPLDIAGLRRQVLEQAAAPTAPQSRQALMAKYGLAPTAPSQAPAKRASLPQRLSSAMPASGTPQMAGLGAAGRAMLEMSGYQPAATAPSIGQILARSAEAGIGTMRERRAAEAAAARQKEQDELTRRYREAQIKQMGQQKGLDIKKPYSVDAVRDGVRGTVQKQYLGRGAPGANEYGVVEIPNSFVPDPAKTPAVQVLPEDKAAAESQKSINAYVTKYLEKYDKEAVSANQLAGEYEVIQNMLTSAEDIDTGPITEMILPLQKIMGELGFLSESEMNEVNTLTTLDAKMKYIVPRMREDGSGSTSNFEMSVFKSAAPGLAKTREANILLAAMARQAAKHKVQVQDVRRRLALGDGTGPMKVPSDKEVGAAVEAEYGSIFKTPFGRQIDKKDFAEVEAELDAMISDGRVNIGDVVYLGKHYKGADNKVKNGGFYVVSAEDI